jgi:hypothetical protein
MTALNWCAYCDNAISKAPVGDLYYTVTEEAYDVTNKSFYCARFFVLFGKNAFV